MKTALLLLPLTLSWLAPDTIAAQGQPPGNTASGTGMAVEARKTETQIFRVTDASELGKDLDARGRANVYGILFETDTADIKPESQSQLAAIADLMTKDPGLRLDVVGHTDNQDGASDNLKLSDMRAFSVVAELSLRYRIDRARLNPFGQGLGRPVASNTDEAGRALNRRVELVRR